MALAGGGEVEEDTSTGSPPTGPPYTPLAARVR